MKRFETYVGFCTIGIGSILIFMFGIIGYSNIHNIPEMPETVAAETYNVDEKVAGCEWVIQKNTEELDRMLLEALSVTYETGVVMVEDPYTYEYETVEETTVEDEPEHFIPDISVILALETEPETESETIIETVVEIEPVVSEPSFVPVDSMMNPDLQKWVYEYETSRGIDPYIIMAICERESCCIANIYGDNGKAYGIMQVQVRWVQDKLRANGFTNDDMLYAQNNIVIGTEILQDHLARGNGMRWALMAYNGGVQQAGSPATQAYADWVLNRAEELRP